MRLTAKELSEKYKIPLDVVHNALTKDSVEGIREPRNDILCLTYDEDTATEAIASYISTKVHESYITYAKWEKHAKRFDAVVLGKEDANDEDPD